MAPTHVQVKALGALHETLIHQVGLLMWMKPNGSSQISVAEAKCGIHPAIPLPLFLREKGLYGSIVLCLLLHSSWNWKRVHLFTYGHSCASLPELYSEFSKTFANGHGLGWKGIHDRMCSMHQSSWLKFTYYQLRQSFKERCKVFHFLFRFGRRIASAELDRKANWVLWGKEWCCF